MLASNAYALARHEAQLQGFWSRLKYYDNRWMDCHDIISQRIPLIIVVIALFSLLHQTQTNRSGYW